jgi:hypothetical protein
LSVGKRTSIKIMNKRTPNNHHQWMNWLTDWKRSLCQVFKQEENMNVWKNILELNGWNFVWIVERYLNKNRKISNEPIAFSKSTRKSKRGSERDSTFERYL